MIEVGAGPPRAGLSKVLQHLDQLLVESFRIQMQCLGGGRDRLSLGEDILAGEFLLGVQFRRYVTLLAHPEVRRHPTGPLGPDHRAQFSGGPDVEGALGVVGSIGGDLAVGVLGGIKTAFRVGQIAKDVVEDVAGQPAVAFVAGGTTGLEEVHRDLRLVVEHFFKMRNEPAGIDRVAVKAAADMVMHAPPRHGAQGVGGHAHRLGAGFGIAALQLGATEEKGQYGRPGKFGRAAKATLPGVVVLIKILIPALKRGLGGLKQIRAGSGALRRGGPAGGVLAQGVDHPRAFGGQLGSLRGVAPSARNGPEKGGKAWAAGTVFDGKIGAAVEGFEVRSEPGTERPAAMAGHRLHVRHVHAVNVRAFLAVDLDRDKAVVEQRGDLFVLERLVRHDVTPVTRGISDTKEDRFVLGAGPRESRFAPLLPVHRIVGVLAQVGRLGVSKTVRHRSRRLSFQQKESREQARTGDPAGRAGLTIGRIGRIRPICPARGVAYWPSTQAKMSGATIVASLSTMYFGVLEPSLPQVIFSFGTAPE